MASTEVFGRDFNEAWTALLDQLFHQGQHQAPRGIPIRELCGVKLCVGTGLANILVSKERALNYRFMLAEFLWIYFGHDDVKTIAQYNKNIANFSDNGINFNGAYGVPIDEQWYRTRQVLLEDHDTRQAVIQIYRTPARDTKDVPCTIACQFLIRDGELHVIVYMRSSDVWLGLPYDFYNFSQLGNAMCGHLADSDYNVSLGSVTFMLGSSHLYEKNFDDARSVLTAVDTEFVRQTSAISAQMHEAPYDCTNDVLMMREVCECHEHNEIDRRFQAALVPGRKVTPESLGVLVR